MVKKVLLVVGGMIAGIALAFGIPASAGTHGGYGTPTPTPTPTVTPPVVVNPFAGCNFSVTEAFTFDPVQHRFVTRLVPAIVCDTSRGVRVYDLVSGNSLRR
jgi:hypothetical protein